MRRRRVIVGLVVLVVVGAAAVLLWPRSPRPCRATFELVRDGMTRDEVFAIVGGLPGDYRHGASVKPLPEINSSGDCDEWQTDDGSMDVYYRVEYRTAWSLFGIRQLQRDPDVPLRVQCVNVWKCTAPSLWSRLRARLGL